MTSTIISTHNYHNPSRPVHVVVLQGGLSCEREVSFSSGKGITEAATALGYKVTVVDMGRDIASLLAELKPDVVFNALHGGYGEDGSLAGMLEILGIKYTHSGVLASAIGMDKLRSRDVFMNNGFKYAEMVLVHKDNIPEEEPIKRPYVIKPISEGSSIGVAVIFPEDDFNLKDYPFKHGDLAIVERYIPGKELQVAIVRDKAIGVMEIRPKGRFYDYEAKYVEGFAEHIYPAPLSVEIYNQAMKLAEDAHNILGCRDINRVEFRYDDSEGGDGGLYILEVNTHPGMTPLSIVPDIARHHNISYNDIVEMLIEQAMQR